MKYFYRVWTPSIEPKSRRNFDNFARGVYRYTAASTALPPGCEVSGEELKVVIRTWQVRRGWRHDAAVVARWAPLTRQRGARRALRECVLWRLTPVCPITAQEMPAPFYKALKEETNRLVPLKQ